MLQLWGGGGGERLSTSIRLGRKGTEGTTLMLLNLGKFILKTFWKETLFIYPKGAAL